MNLISIDVDDNTVAELDEVASQARELEPVLADFARRARLAHRDFESQLDDALERVECCDADWYCIARTCEEYKRFVDAVDALYRQVAAILG